jgi:hypothetical protein
VDKISLPNSKKMLSKTPSQDIAAEIVTFIWPTISVEIPPKISFYNAPQNKIVGSGRISHAGKGKDCAHAQCFVRLATYPNRFLGSGRCLKILE